MSHPDPTPAAAVAGTTPAASLIDNLDTEFTRHVPFAQMAPAHRRQLWAHAALAYYAPGETLIDPAGGPVQQLFLVRSGVVVGERPSDAAQPERVEHEAGECFPVDALLGGCAVTATYRAQGDVFCLLLPGAVVQDVAAVSTPWADHLHRRVLQLLELSRQALQAHFAGQALAEQSLDTPLAQLATRSPLAVAPATPLADALRAMHERRVGSVLVADGAGHAVGILTRQDLLDRVVLPATPLATPIEQVMSAPLLTLTENHRAHDAALLMAAHGVRHVAITDTEGGRLVGVVSERDLFALQRLSLRQLAGAIRGADGVAPLRAAAADIRSFARQLLAQGVRGPQLTALISDLNDRLAARLFELFTRSHGLDPARGAWLAFGSEGRGEQTIATDQDNGLVLAADCDDVERERWRAMGAAVNQALDDCGYPLCKGGVMAGNAACCLTGPQWQQRFEQWIDQGAPEALLAASIFFDLRPVAGEVSLAAPLSRLITTRCAAVPRFIKQLADNALRHRAPLTWLGSIDAGGDGHQRLDLKLQGTALFVEAARLMALARGVAATGTRQRLLALSATTDGIPGVPDDEVQAWVAAFDYLQMLRLGVQARPLPDGANPNLCDVAALNAIDRRVLRESLRAAHHLQQRVELDHAR